MSSLASDLTEGGTVRFAAGQGAHRDGRLGLRRPYFGTGVGQAVAKSLLPRLKAGHAADDPFRAANNAPKRKPAKYRCFEPASGRRNRVLQFVRSMDIRMRPCQGLRDDKDAKEGRGGECRAQGALNRISRPRAAAIKSSAAAAADEKLLGRYPIIQSPETRPGGLNGRPDGNTREPQTRLVSCPGPTYTSHRCDPSACRNLGGGPASLVRCCSAPAPDGSAASNFFFFKRHAHVAAMSIA